MPPTLRPRTPKKSDEKNGGSPEPTKRSRGRGSRDAKSSRDDNGPAARSFALSSSGWLFVYYVGVVKALAERGYHKYVVFGTMG
jgi:hypothetical protein|mmetsp:Transcript_1828/g.6272  ORF Transcript_1828/g.6272 Transcript_1828/m.6272 type:complete len:84 (+) Transcript_1828:592-843(+)